MVDVPFGMQTAAVLSGAILRKVISAGGFTNGKDLTKGNDNPIIQSNKVIRTKDGKGDQMKIEQLEYVVEVARTGSISEAAGKFFLSQSTLSQAIKALEEELGVTLFVRTNRGVILTNFGKEFVSYSKSILLQIDQIRSRSANRRKWTSTLHIASFGYRFMVSSAAKLASRYKNEIEIVIDDDGTNEILDRISADMCELGAYRIWSCFRSATKKQLQAKSLQFFPLAQVPTCIMVGRGNPLYYSGRTSVSRVELAEFPMVIQQNVYDSVQATIVDKLQIPEMRERYITNSASSQYMVLDTTDAYFFGATPRSFRQEEDDYPKVRSLILEDCDITAEIGWIKHERDVLSPLAKEYVEILREDFSQI